jgi:peptidoglycan hydrolase FlgJ
MQIQSLAAPVGRPPMPSTDAQEIAGRQLQTGGAKQSSEVREKFDTFVGETFYGQLMKEMRKTVDKAAYFDGGRAEEIFRGQLDQKIAQGMAKANASTFTGPMFELFALSQK